MWARVIKLTLIFRMLTSKIIFKIKWQRHVMPEIVNRQTPIAFAAYA